MCAFNSAYIKCNYGKLGKLLISHLTKWNEIPLVWISFYVSRFSEFIDAVGDRWGGKTQSMLEL